LTDLFIGASKGFGLNLKNRREESGHEVFHMSGSASSRKSDLTIDWKTVKESDIHRWIHQLPKIGFVFFNQNSSSLSDASFHLCQHDTLKTWKQISHWRQSYYVSCQLPFQIIHALGSKLDETSCVCWALSSMVVKHNHDTKHADYIGNKFQNYMIMKNFSRYHPSCFIGFDPGSLSQESHETKIQNLENIMVRPFGDIDGKVFDSNGNESELYQVFC
jgi:hypothetical protein